MDGAPQSPAGSSEQYEVGNVSSAQLDQKEVDGIAAEIKKGLEPQSSPDNAQGVLHIRKEQPADASPTPPSVDSAADTAGTIYIDQDGTIHQGAEAPGANSAPSPPQQV